ncbi:MAG: hypothetical protein QOJ65_1951 [Fimbriimonadaceae bacterium]|jgi:hypothetical protein|nr:hypothetical protein [Fimbriimonadaceae bacterium]
MPTDRALPDSLRQWKYIEAGAPFFAIRDTGKNKGAANDPNAYGYSASLGKNRTLLSIVSFSKSPKGLAMAKDYWSTYMTQTAVNKATVTPLDDVATRIEFKGDGEGGMPFMLLMVALGHTINGL